MLTFLSPDAAYTPSNKEMVSGLEVHPASNTPQIRELEPRSQTTKTFSPHKPPRKTLYVDTNSSQAYGNVHLTPTDQADPYHGDGHIEETEDHDYDYIPYLQNENQPSELAINEGAYYQL